MNSVLPFAASRTVIWKRDEIISCIAACGLARPCERETASEGAFMKITRVEAIHLRLPNVNERCDGSQETLVVKVHTDAAITGVGEVDSSSVVAKAIIEAPLSHKICRGLAECVLGQDPFEIDRLIHRMVEGSIYYGRQGAVIQAMSGIEIALWDIMGKATGRSV